MTASYTQIALDKVRPGMILSDDLVDDGGKTMLLHGTALTEALLASLRRHGFDTLPILCADLPPDDEQAELAQRDKRLARLFRKKDDSEASQQLHKYIEHFRLGTEP